MKKLTHKAVEAGVKYEKEPTGRAMNYPLGCVLRALCECREELGIDIPQLTTIVVSKRDGRPTYFSKKLGWSDDKIQAEQQAVYNFEQWEHIRQAILR